MAQRDCCNKKYRISILDFIFGININLIYLKLKLINTYDFETVRNARGCMDAILLPLSHKRRAILAFLISAN